MCEDWLLQNVLVARNSDRYTLSTQIDTGIYVGVELNDVHRKLFLHVFRVRFINWPFSPKTEFSAAALYSRRISCQRVCWTHDKCLKQKLPAFGTVILRDAALSWLNIQTAQRPNYVVQITHMWLTPTSNPSDPNAAYLIKRDERADCAHLHWTIEGWLVRAEWFSLLKKCQSGNTSQRQWPVLARVEREPCRCESTNCVQDN